MTTQTYLRVGRSTFSTQKTSPSVFQHKPIGFLRDIRLLFIAPHQSHTSDIWCSTYQVAFSENPSYQALSYTWGDNQLTRTIFCDGKRLAVTENLYLALRKLRDTHPFVPLWIDAVCIDQSNVSERTKQVRLMKQIYQKAEQVIIWLGEEVETDREAFATLDNLNRFFLDFGNDQRNWSVIKGIDSLGDSLQHLNLTAPGWKALSTLFQRPWFTRAWVVQEAAISSRVIVTCGRQTIPWKILSRVVSSLYRRGIIPTFHQYIHNDYGFHRVDVISSIQAISNYSLIDLLNSNRFCDATDPRDKVFAMIGIARDGKTCGIMPDYTMKTTEVYQAVALYLLKSDHPTTTLSFAGDTSVHRTPTQAELPTWVPDWSQRFGRHPFAPPYFAAGNTTAMFRLSKSQKHLTVSGKIIDTVTTVDAFKDRCTHDENMDDDTGQRKNEVGAWLMDNYMELARSISNYPTGEPIEEVLWRTWTCNRTFEGTTPLASFGQAFTALQTCLKMSSSAAEIVQTDPETNAYWQALSLQASSFIAATNRWALRLNLCVTKNKYLGHVPITANAGDLICVILGAGAPFVIRPDPTGNTYQLIGECYVHGMMNGEAMRMPHIAVEDITIR